MQFYSNKNFNRECLLSFTQYTAPTNFPSIHLWCIFSLGSICVHRGSEATPLSSKYPWLFGWPFAIMSSGLPKKIIFIEVKFYFFLFANLCLHHIASVWHLWLPVGHTWGCLWLSSFPFWPKSVRIPVGRHFWGGFD